MQPIRPDFDYLDFTDIEERVKRRVFGSRMPVGFTVNASPRTKNVTATETTPRGKSRAVRKRKRKAQRTARRANR